MRIIIAEIIIHGDNYPLLSNTHHNNNYSYILSSDNGSLSKTYLIFYYQNNFHNFKDLLNDNDLLLVYFKEGITYNNSLFSLNFTRQFMNSLSLNPFTMNT